MVLVRHPLVLGFAGVELNLGLMPYLRSSRGAAPFENPCRTCGKKKRLPCTCQLLHSVAHPPNCSCAHAPSRFRPRFSFFYHRYPLRPSIAKLMGSSIGGALATLSPPSAYNSNLVLRSSPFHLSSLRGSSGRSLPYPFRT